MRLILLLSLFVSWCIACGYWYVCIVKNQCPCNETTDETFEIKYQDSVLFKTTTLFEIERNSPVPSIPNVSNSLVDSIAIYLKNNPSKNMMILSYLTAEESKKNPTIALERAAYIKKLIDDKLNDSTRVIITQAQVEQLFEKNNKSNKGIEIAIIQRATENEMTAIDATQAAPSLLPDTDMTKGDSIDNAVAIMQEKIKIMSDSAKLKFNKKDIVPIANKKTNTSFYNSICDNIPSEPQIYERSFTIGSLNKIQLNNENLEIIDEVKAVIENNTNAIVYIIGNTNNINNETDSYKKSKKWAQEFKTIMTKKGLADWRLKAVGFGVTNPLQPNDTEENKLSNNRIIIKIQ